MEAYDSSDIKILEMPEAIRLRPGMFIGGTTCSGFTGQLTSLFSNAFHQTQSNDILIELGDDFSGKIRFANIKPPIVGNWCVPNYTQPFFFDLEVLNALSDQFTVKFCDKKGQIIAEQYFEKGALKRGVSNDKKYKAPILSIDFQLDKEIWADYTEWNVNQIIYEIWHLAFLHKTIKFDIHYATDHQFCRIIYQFKNGLKDRIDIEKHRGIVLSTPYKTIWAEQQFDAFSLEVAFTFKSIWVDKPFFISYVNDDFTCNEGSHVEGFFKGIAHGLTIFQKKTDSNASKCTSKAVRGELIAAIRVKMDSPNYKGSVRQAIHHPEIVNPIADYVSELLVRSIEENARLRERFTPN